MSAPWDREVAGAYDITTHAVPQLAQESTSISYAHESALQNCDTPRDALTMVIDTKIFFLLTIGPFSHYPRCATV